MSKELLNFMTWVNQDEKLGYTSIGIERIVNRYITSKDLIIRDAYQNYVKTHRVGFLGIKNTIMSQNEFINKCKTDLEFSEKWGLTIEERELNLDERAKLHPNPENFYNIHGTFSISDSIEDSNFPDKDWLHEKFDNGGIPTKLITINYNDKKIESYE
jgi:hypothetical protein